MMKNDLTGTAGILRQITCDGGGGGGGGGEWCLLPASKTEQISQSDPVYKFINHLFKSVGC